MNKNKSKNNYTTVLAVILVIASFLAAAKILSQIVTEHYDDEVIVCLDAGHGGSDCGAVSKDGKRLEKDDVLELTLKIRDRLEEKGIKVLMTREDDSDITLKERCKLANRKRCDLFISVHRNSAVSGSGFEAWISKTEKKNEKRLAQKMTSVLSEISSLDDRGVKKGYRSRAASNYYVNANTNMPSILLEVGFISDDNDNKKFDENIDRYAEELAKCVFDEIIR